MSGPPALDLTFAKRALALAISLQLAQRPCKRIFLPPLKTGEYGFLPAKHPPHTELSTNPVLEAVQIGTTEMPFVQASQPISVQEYPKAPRCEPWQVHLGSLAD